MRAAGASATGRPVSPSLPQEPGGRQQYLVHSPGAARGPPAPGADSAAEPGLGGPRPR